MIETITPAVCGSRTRTALAVTCFAVACVGTAAAVGALAGLVGDVFGPRVALVGAVALLAALAALREATGGRLPIPQSRRQVPERWHHELPLPVWSAGYGAGLGAGVLTFQPFATFPVVLLAAVALGDVATGAAILTAFGVGRVLATLPGEGAIDALARLLGPVRRLNAAALGACALVLALAAPGIAEAASGPGALARATERGVRGAAPASTIDPAVFPDGARAVAERAADDTTTVVVTAPDATVYRFPGVGQPALFRDLVAVADDAGIRVLRYRTGEEVARLDGPWSKPSLQWPWLAAVLEDGGRRWLVARNLVSGAERRLGSVGRRDDIGRPSLADFRVAWHQAGGARSRILTADVRTGVVTTRLASRIALLANPAHRRGTWAWVEQRLGVSRLFVRRRGAARARVALTVRPPEVLWTTATDGAAVWVTRWDVETGRARVVRVPA